MEFYVVCPRRKMTGFLPLLTTWNWFLARGLSVNRQNLAEVGARPGLDGPGDVDGVGRRAPGPQEQPSAAADPGPGRGSEHRAPGVAAFWSPCRPEPLQTRPGPLRRTSRPVAGERGPGCGCEGGCPPRGVSQRGPPSRRDRIPVLRAWGGGRGNRSCELLRTAFWFQRPAWLGSPALDLMPFRGTGSCLQDRDVSFSQRVGVRGPREPGKC